MIFNYEPTDTFFIYGEAHWCSYQTDTLCIFESKEKGAGPPKTFSRKEIGFLRGSNHWRYVPGSRTYERLKKAAKSGSKALQDAHPEDQDAALFAYMECMNLEAFRNAGAISLTVKSLKSKWKEIVGVFLEQEATRNLGNGPRRGGSKLPEQRKPHAASTLLKLYRRLRQGKPVRIRIDPDNIGAVSVEIGRVWHQANALNGEEIEGLSMDHWTRVVRELRQRSSAEAELTLPQRNRAIQKVRKIVDDARDLGGLVDPEYTAESLEYLANNLCAGLIFNHPDTPPVSDKDVPFGRKIEPIFPTQPDIQSSAIEQIQPDSGDEEEWKLEE